MSNLFYTTSNCFSSCNIYPLTNRSSKHNNTLPYDNNFAKLSSAGAHPCFMFSNTYFLTARANDRYQHHNQNVPKSLSCSLREDSLSGMLFIALLFFHTQKRVLLLLILVSNHRRSTLKIKPQRLFPKSIPKWLLLASKYINRLLGYVWKKGLFEKKNLFTS